MSEIGLLAQTACIWEATARKVGNVHRFVDFADTFYLDFILSAAAIAPVLARAKHQRVGRTILDAVLATREITRTNTNLGIILLLAPLASIQEQDLSKGLAHVLDELNVEDARLAYEAIRLAVPGGLGRAAEQDVSTEPTLGLRQVMTLAAEHDLIARQYANGYQDILEWAVPVLRAGLKSGSLEKAIIGCHLSCMASQPDSLIARKCGQAEAEEARGRALATVVSGWPGSQESWQHFAELDAWLRADGNRRNPGTSADLVAASLFVALREGFIQLPAQVPW